jgi:GTPase SAR1 family protein
MLGDSGVGKTNILSRFAKNEFSFETKPTIGVEFSVKNLLINDKIVKM